MSSHSVAYNFPLYYRHPSSSMVDTETQKMSTGAYLSKEEIHGDIFMIRQGSLATSKSCNREELHIRCFLYFNLYILLLLQS